VGELEEAGHLIDVHDVLFEVLFVELPQFSQGVEADCEALRVLEVRADVLVVSHAHAGKAFLMLVGEAGSGGDAEEPLSFLHALGCVLGDRCGLARAGAAFDDDGVVLRRSRMRALGPQIARGTSPA